jgi:uncharacterized membrane protein
MKKVILTTAIATAVLTLSATTHAADTSTDMPKDMEKCKIVDAKGRGLIKEHSADCASKGASCAGSNKAGDPEAWIMVPAGECEKINKGDLSGVSDEIKAKIEGASN